MRTQIDVGIFAYSGITDVENHLIHDAEDDHNAPIASRAYNKPTILQARLGLITGLLTTRSWITFKRRNELPITSAVLRLDDLRLK